MLQAKDVHDPLSRGDVPAPRLLSAKLCHFFALKGNTMTPEDLANRFNYHPPVDAKRALQHKLVRESCLESAEFFVETLPEGREQSLAITKLEEAMFWANAALARTP